MYLSLIHLYRRWTRTSGQIVFTVLSPPHKLPEQWACPKWWIRSCWVEQSQWAFHSSFDLKTSFLVASCLRNIDFINREWKSPIGNLGPHSAEHSKVKSNETHKVTASSLLGIFSSFRQETNHIPLGLGRHLVHYELYYVPYIMYYKA